MRLRVSTALLGQLVFATSTFAASVGYCHRNDALDTVGQGDLGVSPPLTQVELPDFRTPLVSAPPVKFKSIDGTYPGISFSLNVLPERWQLPGSDSLLAALEPAERIADSPQTFVLESPVYVRWHLPGARIGLTEEGEFESIELSLSLDFRLPDD